MGLNKKTAQIISQESKKPKFEIVNECTEFALLTVIKPSKMTGPLPATDLVSALQNYCKEKNYGPQDPTQNITVPDWARGQNNVIRTYIVNPETENLAIARRNDETWREIKNWPAKENNRTFLLVKKN